MSWVKFESIGHSSRNMGPSQKILRPSWCSKLVTGLVPGCSADLFTWILNEILAS